MSDELKNIISDLDKHGKMKFLEGVSDEQITAFEKEKGVTLQPQYKEWLKYSDGGDCFLPAGVQFYGIAHKPLIDVDDNNRPDDNYIVIGALAMGDPLLCEKAGNHVAIYNQEAGRIEEDEIYEDFFSFLIDLYSIVDVEA